MQNGAVGPLRSYAMRLLTWCMLQRIESEHGSYHARPFNTAATTPLYDRSRCDGMEFLRSQRLHGQRESCAPMLRRAAAPSAAVRRLAAVPMPERFHGGFAGGVVSWAYSLARVAER